MEIQSERREGQDLEVRLKGLSQAVLDLVPTPREPAATLLGLLCAHTSPAYLLGLTPPQLAEVLAGALELLGGRQHEVEVRLLPGRSAGRWWLLANGGDAPFLVDSLQALAKRLQLRFQIVSHPLVRVRRSRGQLAGLDAGGGGQDPLESFIVVELEGTGGHPPQELVLEATRVLAAAQKVEQDQAALSRQLALLEQLPAAEPWREFWSWLQQGNFIPMAYRSGAGPAEVALGLDWPAAIAPPWSRHDLQAPFCTVEETPVSSPILRADPLVYIGLREHREPGTVVDHGFLGLFSQQSSDEPAFSVPPLRRRIQQALKTLQIPEGCHDYRKTIDFFNNLPKIELFFMSPAELERAVRTFTLLYRQGAVKALALPNPAGSGVTLLLSMPREYYSQDTLVRIESYLCRFFQVAAVATRLYHLAGDYLSLQVRVSLPPQGLRGDLGRLEAGLSRLTRPWELRLRLELERLFGEEPGHRLWQRYGEGFSREYRTLVPPRFAVRDLRAAERVLAERAEVLELWGPLGRGESHYRVQFYSLRPSDLNALMPYLENLGLTVIEEVDFTLQAAGEDVFVKSFAVRSAGPRAMALGPLRRHLLDALGALRRGEVENDYLNRLLLPTGLSWREIDVFRGYRNYYFQLGSPFTKRRVAFALINQPQVASLLYRYFEARLAPASSPEAEEQREEHRLFPLRLELAVALEAVTDVNEDRILRILFNLIDSTVRTNFFVRRERPDYFFAFKISAIGIIDMPAPRPLYEIYVHAAGMEGIHLRGGLVARGGIRWSDRPDDFRTEILGLMKTQMTKNVVIVPVGSKGGFVVKTPFSSREEGARLSAEAYRILIRGLLDLTDNRRGGQCLRPPELVVYDDPDPYLVVAADKGTAQFSDIANGLSRDYQFWLDDAFASGGSQGYDHKRLGITARGAWECVKAHFRELGRDIQREPFSVVGIGDMSGDVFGNGMLLSSQIRLRAAFDHRHIFLDPEPDPARSLAERRRLFALPRSSWEDYETALISTGGGVFRRDAKDIPLSPPVQAWLGVHHASIDPAGLIRLLLCAETDLLWNGGIGTYVKAAAEKNEEVGDRANDAVRVDAARLHAAVVGEGGNLGFTQRGRVEYALGGGRINTDAVDNSGGVDCSDHEVNLKIFMQQLAEEGLLESRDERDRFLQSLTDEVCAAVLGNNYGQSLCLSLDLQRCREDVEPFLELATRLVDAGLLDRAGEALPENDEVLGRDDRSLTRPELAILMAYAKMQLYQALLDHELPAVPAVQELLLGYFPASIRQRFGSRVAEHPLARELTATVITNRVVNQAGSAFLLASSRLCGASLPAVAIVYLALDWILDGASLRRRIFDLNGQLPAGRQQELLLRLETTLGNLCCWALTRGPVPTLDAASLAAHRRRTDEFLTLLPAVLGESAWSPWREQAANLEAVGLPGAAALRLAALPLLEDVLAVTALAGEGDLFAAATTHGAVRDVLGMSEIVAWIQSVPLRDHWGRLARRSLQEGFAAAAFDLSRAVLRDTGGNPDTFFSGHRREFSSYGSLKEQLRREGPSGFHPLLILLRTLESFNARLIPGTSP